MGTNVDRLSDPPAPSRPAPMVLLTTLYRLGVVIIAGFIVLAVLIVIGRTVIYKVHPYERGLHLRGGRFLTEDEPGWHLQIPLWDTVILVKVNERLGYVDQIRAVTSDDLAMMVSLEYTYRVADPARFALEVDNPERILFEFVQGKLRDVVNTMQMAGLMHGRAEVNERLLGELRAKEAQYGVEFVTVQIQSASPPENVLTAIENRMVASQRKEQADAEAAQMRILADAENYSAQKKADAMAYQITAESESRKVAAANLLAVLGAYPVLANKYMDYLMTQALQTNSKWVLGVGGTPILDLRDIGAETPTPSAPVPTPGSNP
jgi:regulator of protease activity HflC (stomatin/prohibitin superfamily)